jgi:hypothetical protein
LRPICPRAETGTRFRSQSRGGGGAGRDPGICGRRCSCRPRLAARSSESLGGEPGRRRDYRAGPCLRARDDGAGFFRSAGRLRPRV